MPSPGRNPVWSVNQDVTATGYPGSHRLAVFLLLATLIGFLVLGTLSIYSATIADFGNHFFYMQVFWIILGIIICAIIYFIPLKFFYKYSIWGVVFISIPLFYLALAATASRFDTSYLRFFPFTREIKGAVRWLSFGSGTMSISFQPSEFAKFFLLIYLASYYGSLDREKIKDFVPGILIPSLASFCVLGLIFFGKDLSTTVVTAALTMSLMWFAGIRFRYIFIIIVVGALLGVAAIVQNPNRMDRIKAIMDPELYRFGESYQLYRSQLCLGVGGVTGVGYSQGYMKTYLPEPHTDFIVSVIGEELGLVGILLVIGCYLLIFICLYLIARQCRQRKNLLLCLGCGILVITQAIINIGVVSGCCPPTGVTAPFLSYGGSSILSMMMCMGLIFNIAHDNSTQIWQEIQKLRYSPAHTRQNAS